MLVIIATVALVTLMWNIIGSNNVKFDQDRWKNWIDSEAELSLRWDMMEDVQKHHKMIGMTRSEVIDLLGQPTSEATAELSYYLGMARNGINIGRLTLNLNESNVVTSVNVWDG